MRDILFRGKREDNREWVEGSVAQFNKDQCFIMPPHPGASTFSYAQIFTLSAVMVDPSTVGQYAGLTYKNGVKAFEHDCIQRRHSDEIGVIRYGKYKNAFDGDAVPYRVGFYVDWVSGEEKDILRKDLGYWVKCVEVIGNIHDNPELLQGGAEDAKEMLIWNDYEGERK